jgi:hypothetical protein
MAEVPYNSASNRESQIRRSPFTFITERDPTNKFWQRAVNILPFPNLIRDFLSQFVKSLHCGAIQIVFCGLTTGKE